MNNTNAITAIIACAVGIVIGAYLFSTHEHSVSTETKYEVVRDTILYEVHHEPTIITDADADTVIVTRADTVIVTRPFIAKLDTIIVHDTVHAEYAFPQHTFSVAIRQAPDSVRIEQQTVYVKTTEQRSAPWYEYVGSALIGVAVGYVARGNN